MAHHSPLLPDDVRDDPLDEVGELRNRIAELERQVSDYRQVTELLAQLPKVLDADDRPFFPALVETLATSLGADYVIVGELRRLAEVIRVLAIYARATPRRPAGPSLAGLARKWSASGNAFLPRRFASVSRSTRRCRSGAPKAISARRCLIVKATRSGRRRPCGPNRWPIPTPPGRS